MASTKCGPRILIYDEETAPIKGYAWKMYDTDIIAVDTPSYMLSFSAKWLGEKQIVTRGLCDYPGFKRNKTCDRALVTDLHGLMSQADLTVAHNGDSFDKKKAYARFIIHKLKPPPPHKTVDTLKIARRQFRFDSNKLNDLAQYLGIGRKLPTTGIHLWISAMNGDLKSWKILKDYNRHDVVLLEDVYIEMRPWALDHPNLNLFTGSTACPSCQSSSVQQRGFSIARSKRRQRFQCQSCGNWFSGEIVQ